jgi:VRR-NUC domain
MPLLRTEASIQRSVVTYAKSRGVIAIKLTTAGPRGSAGWPDYMFLFKPGNVFFVEFKSAGGRLSEQQARRIDTLRRLGHQAFVVDSVELGKVVIDTMIGG